MGGIMLPEILDDLQRTAIATPGRNDLRRRITETPRPGEPGRGHDPAFYLGNEYGGECQCLSGDGR